MTAPTATPAPPGEPRREPRVMLAIRVSRAGIAAVDAKAKRKGITRSEAVRAALADWARRP